MNYNWLYDRQGIPIAYILLSGEIFAVDGRPLAYLVGMHIYSYSGRCIGFFFNGWLLDRVGAYVLYTAGAIGGPLRPVRRIAPIPCIRHIAPIKSFRQWPPQMPRPILAWSSRYAGLEFFMS